MSEKNTNARYIQSKTVRRLAIFLANKFLKFKEWLREKLTKELRNQLAIDAENDCNRYLLNVFLNEECSRCGDTRLHHDMYKFGEHESGAHCDEFVEKGQMSAEMVAEWSQLIEQEQEKSRYQSCARCSQIEEYHTGKSEISDSEGYELCSNFISKENYTDDLRKAWREEVEDALRQEKYEEELNDPNKYNEHGVSWDEIYEIESERNCSWGEPVWLSYHHPEFGFTKLGMLEGEWLWTFEQWRRNKSRSEEFISALEVKFREALDEYNGY